MPLWLIAGVMCPELEVLESSADEISSRDLFVPRLEL